MTDQPIKILLVDDDQEFAEMYKTRLELEGDWSVMIAHSVEEMHQKLAEKPSFILLDIMMPGTDGYEALRQLKTNPSTQMIPVGMLTALFQENEKKRAENLGAEAYFVKSEVPPTEVIARIKQLLGVSSVS